MQDVSVVEDFELGKLVTFIPNKKYPVYNWFHFKEGFSRDFVLMMIDHFMIKKGGWILDPFCGVGTTLLASRERGINSVGVDAMPLAIFISQVKVAEYDVEKLKATSRKIFAERFVHTDVRNVSSLVRRSFSKYALEDILFFRNVVAKIEDPIIRNFFILALMISSEHVSYAYKDGAVVKIRRRQHVPPFRPVFKRVVKKMVNDIKRFKDGKTLIKIVEGDARNLDFLDDSSFDAIITSPPYLNIIDYTKVYALENELFIGLAKAKGLRSYIGLNVDDFGAGFPGMDVPPIGKAYFRDMKMFLSEGYRVLKAGGSIAMVVGEGVFPDKIIPVHSILSEISQDVGFKVEKILHVNRRTVTDHQRHKIGSALESILFLKK
ncbi:MAG: DNA methyltransferase [Nitrososphaeria archaeon]